MTEGRWVRRCLLLLALIALCWTVLPGGSAAAHATLEDTSPPASSVLRQPPTEIRLDFATPVESRFASIELFDAHASKVLLGTTRRASDDDTALVSSVPLIGDGPFVVVWRVVSTDGYPTEGSFTFQVGETSAGAPVDVNDLLARVLAGRHSDRTVGWLLGLARWVGLLGVIVLIGASLQVAWHGLPSVREETVRRLLWTAWSWTLVGSLGVLLLQGPYVARRSVGDVVDPVLWGEVLATRAGRALEFRWAFLLAAGYLLVTLRRSHLRWWRLSGAAVAIGLVLTFAVVGHPAGRSTARLGRPVAVGIDAVHLVAASLWLGGMVALLTVGRSWRAADGVSAPWRRFSLLASVAVPVVVVTGALQAVNLAGGVDELSDVASTTWGRVLIVKVAIVAVLLVVAAVARWLLRTDGLGDLGRLLATELVLGLAVVSMSAALVALPPRGEVTGRPVSATLVSQSVLLEVLVTPATPGGNEVHVVFVPPGGSLQQVSDARATLSRPDRVDDVVEIELAFAGPNHWSGLVRIPTGGRWVLDVSATSAAGSPLRYQLDVPVGS